MFVFSPLVFSKNFLNINDWKLIILTFFGFSMIASSSYILNDILDKGKDKHHPEKKNRPLPSGRVRITEAIALFFLTFSLGILINIAVNIKVFYVSITYFLLIFLYSTILKKIVIIDIITIAIGFDLRAMAGAVAINVVLSQWLIVDLFLLALFLAATKRRQELLKLSHAEQHKKVLDYYSLPLLDQIIPILTSTTLLSYIIYTLSDKVKEYFQTDYFYLSIPFVIYGIFRYLFIIYKEDTFGDPTKILVNDFPLLLDLFLWGISIMLIIYF
jgi:4-hydroxybenzoate polyprenyltransferase